MGGGHRVQRDVILRRREAVARARLEGRCSVREIARALEEQGLRNRDGKPWGKTAIHQDLQALRERWQEEASQDFQAWLSEEVAAIRDVRRRAWALAEEPDSAVAGLDLILKSHDRLAKLLGLAAPTQAQVSLSAQATLDPQTVAAADARLRALQEKAFARGAREERARLEAALPEVLPVAGDPGGENPAGENGEDGDQAADYREARRRDLQAYLGGSGE